MSKENEINELLGRFLDAQKAKQAAEDIKAGEKILRDYPAPKFDEESKVLLKIKVAKALEAKRARNLRYSYFKAAAIAAGFLVVGTLSVLFMQNKPMPQVAQIISSISGGTDIFNDNDAEIDTLNSEIEQFKNELATVQWESGSGSQDNELNELEMELIEINSDFWKG